jgi:hypothetical protein
MMTNHLARVLAGAALVATLSGPALAEGASTAAPATTNAAGTTAPASTAPAASPAQPTTAPASTDAPVDTYKSVIGQGYEIKAVTLFAGDQQDLLLGKTGSLPAVMVVLQKQQQTAVCIFAAAAWENLQIAALDTAKNCSVY